MPVPIAAVRGHGVAGGELPLAVPVPTLGAELLTNGNMETGDPPTGWNGNGASTLASDPDPHTGAKSLLLTRGTVVASAYRNVSTVVGDWYLLAGWIKNVSAASAMMHFYDGAITRTRIVTATDWTQGVAVARRIGAQSQIYMEITGSAGQQAKFDDLSMKKVTLASMFSVRPYTTHVTVKASVTVVSGTRAGVVANLDSATSPANFVIASHNGTNAILEKCVAGTYTQLISAAATYSAGAFVEVRRPAGGDIWQLYYNGSKVGADVTISDAAIKAATLNGYFNSYGGNVVWGFSCLPS